MLIAAFPAGPWGTNCYVAATAPGSECIVIDPGKDAAAGVAEVVREHRLKPVAVLLTHGHVDHMWSVTPVAGAYDATAWIHPDDRHLLADPMAGLSPESAGMLLGATTPDGCVEAFESAPAGGRPGQVLAVQWHPEVDAATNSRHQALFDWLVGAARDHRAAGDQSG